VLVFLKKKDAGNAESPPVIPRPQGASPRGEATVISAITVGKCLRAPEAQNINSRYSSEKEALLNGKGDTKKGGCPWATPFEEEYSVSIAPSEASGRKGLSCFPDSRILAH
jgi:hypothetical protein